eukprot:SAG25_NODE_408_length_8433_cov_5.830934_5_plen_78_part_00
MILTQVESMLALRLRLPRDADDSTEELRTDREPNDSTEELRTERLRHEPWLLLRERREREDERWRGCPATVTVVLPW